MYTLLVFLFKDVEFPQVALLGAFFALAQKDKRTNYYKNKRFKNTMLVFGVFVICQYICFCGILTETFGKYFD